MKQNKNELLTSDLHPWIRTYSVETKRDEDGRPGILLGSVAIIRGKLIGQDARRTFGLNSCLTARDDDNGELIFFFEGPGPKGEVHVGIANQTWRVISKGFLRTDNLTLHYAPVWLTSMPWSPRVALARASAPGEQGKFKWHDPGPLRPNAGYEHDASDKAFDDMVRDRAREEQRFREKYG